METNFNFKSSVCTSREQSERLLALGLKKETADCCYYYYDGEYLIAFAEDAKYPSDIPAWGLHRLIEMLTKYGINVTFIDNIVVIDRHKVFQKSYEFWDDVYDNICDAIEWLIKEGYFSKEYLVNQAEIEDHCKGVLEYLDYIRGEEE